MYGPTHAADAAELLQKWHPSSRSRYRTFQHAPPLVLIKTKILPCPHTDNFMKPLGFVLPVTVRPPLLQEGGDKAFLPQKGYSNKGEMSKKGEDCPIFCHKQNLKIFLWRAFD